MDRNTDLWYSEDFDFDDYYVEALQEDYVYIEDFDTVDYGLEESFDKEDCEEDEDCEVTSLREDLNSSLPFKAMGESTIKRAADKVKKGAKVKFGYFKELKLDAKYAKGKFVKSENKQYDLVKALKVTEVRGCTGVRYDSTEGAVALHNTSSYQKRKEDKIASTGAGFGDSNVPTPGYENILITTLNGVGKKCIIVYPLTISTPRNTYYISINGEDWRQTTKEEIAKYMSPTAGDNFLHPENNAIKEIKRQAKIYDENGNSVTVDVDELSIKDSNGERLKVKTHPIFITYSDPNSPFFGVYRFDKESSLEDKSVKAVPTVEVEEDPLALDFPEIE